MLYVYMYIYIHIYLNLYIYIYAYLLRPLYLNLSISTIVTYLYVTRIVTYMTRYGVWQIDVRFTTSSRVTCFFYYFLFICFYFALTTSTMLSRVIIFQIHDEWKGKKIFYLPTNIDECHFQFFVFFLHLETFFDDRVSGMIYETCSTKMIGIL